MAVDLHQQGHCVNSQSVFSDETPTDLQSVSKLAISSIFEVLNPFRAQICLDAQLNCPNSINSPMEKPDIVHSSCYINVDIEKGNMETSISIEEKDNSKAVSSPTYLQRVLHTDISLHIGGKLMQLLVDHSLMLLKFISRDKPVTEKVHDTHMPNNRGRKYKRSASFDSRKVVFLFSVLSIIGTVILIFLTLRVWQIGDSSVPI